MEKVKHLCDSCEYEVPSCPAVLDDITWAEDMFGWDGGVPMRNMYSNYTWNPRDTVVYCTSYKEKEESYED